MVRYAGPVEKPEYIVVSPALKPFVGGGRRNAVVTAKGTDVRPIL